MSEVEKRQGDKKIALLFALCGLLFAGMVGISILLFTRGGDETSSRAKSEGIIKKVEKLYITPSAEVPTVAEIQNKDNLPKNNEFYKGAQNGDFLLVYNKAKVAILYRESINKLVRVSPVIPTEASEPKQR